MTSDEARYLELKEGEMDRLLQVLYSRDLITNTDRHFVEGDLTEEEWREISFGKGGEAE